MFIWIMTWIFISLCSGTVTLQIACDRYWSLLCQNAHLGWPSPATSWAIIWIGKWYIFFHLVFLNIYFIHGIKNAQYLCWLTYLINGHKNKIIYENKKWTSHLNYDIVFNFFFKISCTKSLWIFCEDISNFWLDLVILFIFLCM